MPDPILILKAVTAAAVTAAAVLLLLSWPWRAPHPARISVGWVLGVGLGFFLGCWLLGVETLVEKHWPPRDDQDRFLLVLFPALIGVELVAAILRQFWWLVWPLRLIVAASAARVLLHNSTYITDLAGPGTREWTPAQTWMILGGLAAVLVVVWASLNLLAWRTPGRSVPLAVALACAGAAVTIMLSGYASAGEIGLPLAAALVGASVVSLALAPPPEVRSALGVGIVGLFALLVIGHFFGKLAPGHAVLLFLAPLLCGLPDLPRVRRMGPWLRGLTSVGLTAVPVAIVLILAQQKFVEESTRTSPGSKEPSIQDYLDFGK